MKKTRFILITVPPEETGQHLTEALRLISQTGKTKTANSYPPHVTLRTGAIVPDEDIDRYIVGLEAHLGQWQPFPVNMIGIEYETFSKAGELRYFIYYTIQLDQNLRRLNSHLMAYRPFIKRKKTEFKPHLSLAYDDLDSPGFEAIQRLIEDRSDLFQDRLVWMCDNLGLYHFQHGRWKPYHVIRFSQPAGKGNHVSA